MISLVDIVDEYSIDTITFLEDQREKADIINAVLAQVKEFKDLGIDLVSSLPSDIKQEALDNFWSYISDKQYFAIIDDRFKLPIYMFMIVDNFRYLVPSILDQPNLYTRTILINRYNNAIDKICERILKLKALARSQDTKDKLDQIIVRFQLYKIFVKNINDEYIEWLSKAVNKNLDQLILASSGGYAN